MFPDVVVKAGAEMLPNPPEPGLTRLIGAYNEKLFLAEHRMQAGWAGIAHSHTCAPANRLSRSAGGDSFVIKGGVEHQAWAIEPSVVIDVFTPYREDYV